MAMTINTNVVSLNAQRNLGLSGSQLGISMQRLSSGLRVNSAKDDAAGLAIAERMSAQARGLAVAARNANDGISLAQTAEGALGKMGDMLQRMRELAVQASNATNSADDRKALQAEVNQLRSEIDRVAKTTSFNGTKILDGSFAGGVFQVGAGAGDNITVGGIANAKASELSKISYGTDAIKIDLSGMTVNIATGGIKTAGTATGVVTADITTNAAAADFKLEILGGFATKIEAGTLTIKVGASDAIDIGEIAAASSKSERLGQVVAAINAKTADTGVTAFLELQADGTFELSLMSSKSDPATGAPLDVTLAGFTLENAGFLSQMQAAPAAVSPAVPTAITWGTANEDAKQAYEKQLTEHVAAFNQNSALTKLRADQGTASVLASTTLKVVATEMTDSTNVAGIDTLSVATQKDAWVALQKIDSAIDQVNSARANLGALQTRFEKSIENIDIMNENISAARGRIVDADFASETASLSRTQILQQAGTAMVAQANQLPQQVLSLLQ